MKPISLGEQRRESQAKILIPKIMKEKLKPVDNESRLKSKIIASLDQSFEMAASDREHSTFI